MRLYHRTEFHWTRHLSAEAPLDAGVAFANPELPECGKPTGCWTRPQPRGRRRRNASGNGGILPSLEALCTVDAEPLAPAARTAPLVEYLESSGWHAAPVDVLYLAGRPVGAVREAGGLTSSRAGPASAIAQAGRRRGRLPGEPQLADAAMLHLDDPHYDALIELKDGEVVGRVGVLAVGDVGRIEHVYVAGRGGGGASLGR